MALSWRDFLCLYSLHSSFSNTQVSKFITRQFEEDPNIRQLCSKILCKEEIKFVTGAGFGHFRLVEANN